MSISNCPIPDPGYRELVSALGEYQAGRLYEAASKHQGIPEAGSKDLADLIDFWKKKQGFEGEAPLAAKTRILRQFGKSNTRAITSPQYFKEVMHMTNDYNRMKGKKYLSLVKIDSLNYKLILTAQENITSFPVNDGIDLEPQFTATDYDGDNDRVDLGPDNLSGAKFRVLMITYKNKKRDIERQIVNLRQKRKESSDPKTKAKLNEDIQNLKAQTESIETDIKALEGMKAVETIMPFAQRDFDEIRVFLTEEALSNPDLVDFNQMEFARKLLNTWLAVSDSTSADHPFLDQMDLEVPEIVAGLEKIYSDARFLNQRLENIAYQKIANETGTYLGKKISVNQLRKPIEDTGLAAANLLALGRMDNTLLQAIAMKIKDVEIMSAREYQNTDKKFTDLLNKAFPKMQRLNSSDPFAIFKQVTEDGFETGNVVYRISQDFFDTRNRLYRIANKAETAEDRSKGFKKLFEWQNENEIYIDPSRLEDVNYIAELERNYGQRGIDRLIERVKSRSEAFQQDYEAAKILYESEVEGAELDARLDAFDKKYNPKYYLENLSEKKFYTVNGETIYPTTKYIESIPRRFKGDTSEETGFYDSKYDVIMQDNDLFNLHDQIIDMIAEYKRYLPYSVGSDLHINSIPSLSKGMMELYSQEGFKQTGSALLSSFQESWGSNLRSEVTNQAVDPLTNSIDPSLGFKLQFDGNREVMLRVKERILSSKAEGIDVTDQDRARFYKEEMHKMSTEKSWDLGKVMRVFASAAIEYKHKARVEDLLMWQKRIFEKTPQLEQTFGRPRFQADGKALNQPGDQLTNYKSTLDHTMNAFLGMPMRDIEGVSKKKFYSKDQVKKKKEYESKIRTAKLSFEAGEITNAEFEEITKTFEDKISELGQNLSVSAVGDNLMQYFQLKGMGWNVFAGISNVGFGLISNILMAADGREFTEKNFWQSMRIALASITNNATFDQTKGITTPFFKEAVKLRNLMDKNNILKEASQEMFKRTANGTASSLERRMKFMNPYNPQMRSEYLVQSMILSAMMKADKNKVTDLNGNLRPLWDAFDMDGNWNFEEFGVQDDWSSYDGKKLLSFLRRVDSVIAEAHGDYTNPLRIKKNLLGRAMAQFRTWMFEGYANRFEQEYFDENRGYIRKGRYKSFDAGSATIAGALAGTGVFPGLGTIAGAAVGYGVGKYMGIPNANGMSDLQSIWFTLKQLFKRMLITQNIGSTDLSMDYNETNGFTEVDAANMRKNMTELAIYIYLYSFGAIMKSVLEDLPEKEKLVLTFLINQGNRLETDILFYTNPLEFRTLVKQIIPAMSLVDDARKWFDALYRQFDGRENMMSGPFEGENILLRRSLENIPLGTQYYKMRKNAKYVMDM